MNVGNFVIGHSFKAVEAYPLPQAIFSFNIYVEGQPKKNHTFNVK